MNGKLLLVGVLAIILLILYLYTMHLEINVAMDCADDMKESVECVKATKAHESFVTIFSGVGGIIAAFAVSALAVSEPGGPPTAGINSTTLVGMPEKIAKAIPVAFVVTWVICGLLAVYFGLKYNGSAPLTEMAKTWFGTVIAGVGAYLGYKPG